MQHKNKEKQRAIQEYKAHCAPKSPVKSPILLWREVPMDYGATIDSLTPKINPFLYARETKYLTLKDLYSYVIMDG